MIVALHVTIALSSIISTSYLFLRPSRNRFLLNYCLVGLTFLSGIYLVIASHAALVPACTAGLVYLSVVTAGMVAAQHRFTHSDKS